MAIFLNFHLFFLHLLNKILRIKKILKTEDLPHSYDILNCVLFALVLFSVTV